MGTSVGAGVRMRMTFVIVFASVTIAYPMAMADVDLGGVRVAPKFKLMMCGLEGNALTMWTRFFIELEGGEAAQAVQADPNEVWQQWEAACSENRAPCVKEYATDDTWTSMIVLRDPRSRLVAAYKKLCNKNSDGSIPEGYEDTCPLFPAERPYSFDVWVKALMAAKEQNEKDDPFVLNSKLRPQARACGAPPESYTHVLLEDDDNYVGRVRSILRDAGVDSNVIERFFYGGASFDKGKDILGNDDAIKDVISTLYAEDYALVQSEAARATAPPEPETTTTETPPAPRDAPSSFCVEMLTTKGSFMLESQRAWAPIGVQRFWDLVQSGFYGEDGNGGIGIFRNAPGFVSQFGIHGVPEIAQKWDGDTIEDDPMVAGVGNSRGWMTFAMAGPHSRGSQLFFNLKSNGFLDDRGGFPPIARCIRDCDVIYSFEAKYGEAPNQGRIYSEGNAYLHREFPDLDYITGARVVPCPPAPERVRCDTTKGTIDIDVHHEWAPNGALRLLRLVDEGYFNASVPLFRCLKGWICQFGGTRNPVMTRYAISWGPWLDLSRDARPWMRKGLISFAGSGPNSRWGELFFSTAAVNLGGGAWEVPVAELVGGASFEVLDSFYSGYGEIARFGGHAPDQRRLQAEGGAYLDEFPDLDYITGCARVDGPRRA